MFTVLGCILCILQSSTLFADDEIDAYISKMTLEEKVGEIMMIGFKGKHLKESNISHIKTIKPGGIVFYARNFSDASDLSTLIATISSVSQKNDLPIFFAIDQEGGIVRRIKGELFTPPSHLAIGAVDSEVIAHEVGLSVGHALRGIGININFAPVLDIPADILTSPIATRSFSNNPETVDRLGRAYIKGLKSTGMRDLMPFIGAIEEEVDLIMTGHVIASPGDDKNPVPLSLYWLKDVLRKEMGFTGLIIVDNIEMKAIADKMPVHEAAVRSFNAGADIIMVSHEREQQKAVFHALLNAATMNDISTTKLNDSLKRIVIAKKRIHSFSPKKTRTPNLNDIQTYLARNTVIALKKKTSPFVNINKGSRVLYAGHNLFLLNALKNNFRQADVLDMSLLNYNKIKPKEPIRDFMQTFDGIIVDADYEDASTVVSLCDELRINYFVVQSHLSNINKSIERLNPGKILIVLENNRNYLEVVSEIIAGVRKPKGRLSFNLPFSKSYELIITDMR
jgi:beta-N-acetylhexosaminidase